MVKLVEEATMEEYLDELLERLHRWNEPLADEPEDDGFDDGFDM